MNKTTVYIILSLAIHCFVTSCFSRSVFRTINPSIPRVQIRWKNNDKVYTSHGYHHARSPIFTVFDEKFFFKHYLPKNTIPPRNKTDNQVKGEELGLLIEKLLEEIQEKKSEFQDFSIIQTKNFNLIKQCGLIILKFKNYPFVVKLFIENPKTFFSAYDKGVESLAFFYMSGGTNRHITGLTRIKTLQKTMKIIKRHKRWSQYRYTFPRKWFWLPANPQWLYIDGFNTEGKAHISTKIPAIYAIVADFIDTTESAPLEKDERKKIIIKLCNDLDTLIDPHANNFVINKEDQTLHIKMIDTEHFPTLVGFKKPKKFRTYNQWYLQLIEKCIYDMYFLFKPDTINQEISSSIL